MEMKVKLPGGGVSPALPETARISYNGPSFASALMSTRKTQAPQRFDRFTSTAETGRSSYHMELRGRISQDVRTATSSGMVASLREEIQAGTYQPDPAAIARKMLLMTEAE